MAKISLVKLSELYGAYRWDAECYEPEVLRDEHALAHFPTVKLGEIAYVTDGQHGYHEVDEESDIRHITARCVEDGVVTDGKADRLSATTHNANPRSQLKAGDVLLSTAGTIGDAGIVGSDILPANIDQDVARIALNPDSPIDPHFLVAFLRSELGQFQCRRATTGQIQGHIALNALRDFDIPIVPDQGPIVKLMRRGVAARNKVRLHLIEASDIMLRSLGLLKLSLSSSLFYERSYSDMSNAGRFDAEYFSPRFQHALAILRKDGLRISDVSDLAERRFRPELRRPDQIFRYIEISSIRGDGLADSAPVENSEAPSRAKWIVQEGDVISSTVRPIRRLSAIITNEQSGYVCSSGFTVLQPKENVIEPEVLLTYLRLPIICEILDLHTTASMYPAISTARMLEIPIPKISRPTRKEVVSKVQAAFAAVEDSHQQLQAAKAEVERLIILKSK
jgi:restriction endonuclease S subunit